MSSPDPLDSPVDLDRSDTEPHHPHGDAHDPVHDEVESHVDPAVAEAVHSVRDRFGASGLRDLIALAGYELDLAQQALASLRAELADAPSQEADVLDVPLASGLADDGGGAASR